MAESQILFVEDLLSNSVVHSACMEAARVLHRHYGSTAYPPPESSCFFVMDGDQVVALLCSYPSELGQYVVSQGWVDAPYRGRGLYRRLYNATFAHAQSLGFTKLLAAVHIGNTHSRFVHERLGMKADAVFYSSPIPTLEPK
jgi:GNAT superfamily N-acetyltransferase